MELVFCLLEAPAKCDNKVVVSAPHCNEHAFCSKGYDKCPYGQLIDMTSTVPKEEDK